MSESRSVYTAYQGNSYLFGGNAPVCRGDVRKLPRQSRQRSRELARLFRRAPERARRRRQQRQGCPAPAGDQRVRRARQAGRHAGGGRPRRRFRDGPQAHGGAAAHRRLPQRRLPLGRPRPAQARRAREDSRARSRLLRLQRCRPGSGVQHQQHLLRQGHDVAARADQRAARNLLRHHRRRVHVHHRPAQEALVAAEARVDPQQAEFLASRRRSTSSTASRPPKAWSASCTPSTSARSASRWKAARASSPRWTS